MTIISSENKKAAKAFPKMDLQSFSSLRGFILLQNIIEADILQIDRLPFRHFRPI